MGEDKEERKLYYGRYPLRKVLNQIEQNIMKYWEGSPCPPLFVLEATPAERRALAIELGRKLYFDNYPLLDPMPERIKRLM